MRKEEVKYLKSVQNKFNLKEAEFMLDSAGREMKRSPKNRFRFLKRMWSDLSQPEKEIIKKALAT